MSATRLLVLAFVRAHGRAHGYRVGQDLLAWNADKWANTKTGSIYHALRQLAKEGLLKEYEMPATDNSLVRTEYEMSEAGGAEFFALLEKALVVPEPRPDMFCAGLVMMSALPRQAVIKLLNQRLATLAQQRTNVDRASTGASWTGEHALPPHVDALLNFWSQHTNCSHDWVESLVRKIEDGAYEFTDDNPRAFGTPGSLVSRE